MIEIQSLSYFNLQPISVTIGNFDGLHLGHQEFFSNALKGANELKIPLVLITFEPHPRVVLSGKKNFLINTKEEKAKLFQDFGIPYTFQIPFTRELSQLSGEEFFNNYIFTNSTIKKIFLGYDFSLGANKSFGPKEIKKFCEERNVSVDGQEEYKIGKDRVNSSEIRNYILKGKIEKANQLLGRKFFITGEVVKGMERGRTLGFPTANLSYNSFRLLPGPGVYASEVEIDGTPYFSVTNIGKNPTFKDDDSLTVESYILNFDQNIYGKNLKLSFIGKLREEIKFAGPEFLKEQIQKDIEKAKGYFGGN